MAYLVTISPYWWSRNAQSLSTSGPVIRAHRVIDPTTGTIDVRRIEVKGNTRGNDIQLTVNEWNKAQQLGPTYWLCVVWNPLEDDRELVSIHNPAEKLD